MKWSKTVLSVLSIAVVGLLALGIVSTPAVAATATATFDVTVTVATSCSASATALAFGTYDGSALNGSSSGITVTCTNGTPYTIALDTGKNGGSENTRYMLHGTSDKVAYTLFSDASRLVPWNTGTNIVSSTGTGSAQAPFPVYGTIAQGQAVVAGSYIDTITATITY
jgi:spore coat protein U-like protein